MTNSNDIVKVESIKFGFKILLKIILSGLSLVFLLLTFFLSDDLARIDWRVYVAIIAFLMLTSSILALLYLTQKWRYIKPFKNWVFDTKTGLWSDGKMHFCPNCKTDLIISPLRMSEKGWQCTVKSCGTFVRNPDYNSPPIKTRPRSGWMEGY